MANMKFDKGLIAGSSTLLVLTLLESGYQQQAPSGRMRKYYRLTRKGRELLAEKKAEWASFHRGVADVLSGGANALA